MLLPIVDRRSLLEEEREFQCLCARCAEGVEDLRVFRCARDGCAGACKVVGQLLGHCCKCGVAPGRAKAEALFASEMELEQLLNFIDDVLDNGKQIDVSGDVLSLSLGALHENQYLAGRIARVQYELFLQFGHLEKAVVALGQTIRLWQNIRPCRETAFELERLGNLYKKLGRDTAATKAYYDSFRILALTSGLENAYVRCAARLCAQSLLKVPMRASALSGFEGKAVLVVGLAKKAVMNGCIGSCGSLEIDRFPVRFNSVDTAGVKVKAVNLKVLPDGQLEPGQLAIIHGLSSET
ncbi:unnamed protein product [Symbiodinium natans]|uniref:Uncharacterized protein n=1 Tax=Symbiodinium natans TaxID=878477 RepID=A0A812PVD6_9DINO|nr:unnamed protein product [Symbiodinium natans]